MQWHYFDRCLLCLPFRFLLILVRGGTARTKRPPPEVSLLHGRRSSALVPPGLLRFMATSVVVMLTATYLNGGSQRAPAAIHLDRFNTTVAGNSRSQCSHDLTKSPFRFSRGWSGVVQPFRCNVLHTRKSQGAMQCLSIVLHPRTRASHLLCLHGECF